MLLICYGTIWISTDRADYYTFRLPRKECQFSEMFSALFSQHTTGLQFYNVGGYFFNVSMCELDFFDFEVTVNEIQNMNDADRTNTGIPIVVIVLKPKRSYLIGRFYRNRSAHLKLTNRDQAHQILFDRMDSLNLKYQKSVTISCDWSIVALVTDRAWCERRITVNEIRNMNDAQETAK